MIRYAASEGTLLCKQILAFLRRFEFHVLVLKYTQMLVTFVFSRFNDLFVIRLWNLMRETKGINLYLRYGVFQYKYMDEC